MKLKKLFHIKKSRKYPIKRDGRGLSLRARCFAQFDQGKRPAEAAQALKMNEATVFRYYRDWKRLGPDFAKQYSFVKGLLKKTAPDRERDIELFARMLGLPKEQFKDILSRPHGLRQFLTGKLYFPANADMDHKMHVSLELALLISDHVTKNGGKFEDVYLALDRWLREAARHRRLDDAVIEKENEFKLIIHQALKVEIERERQSQVKPDTFTEKERDALIRIGLHNKYKKLRAQYWVSIGDLMAKGLTMEQAREKLYQDVVAQGNPRSAKYFRDFQNAVHPLRDNKKPPPPAPPQPPTPP